MEDTLIFKLGSRVGWCWCGNPPGVFCWCRYCRGMFLYTVKSNSMNYLGEFCWNVSLSYLIQVTRASQADHSFQTPEDRRMIIRGTSTEYFPACGIKLIVPLAKFSLIWCLDLISTFYTRSNHYTQILLNDFLHGLEHPKAFEEWRDRRVLSGDLHYIWQ